MAFTYQPGVNPYAPSIGDLIAHAGDIRAQAALHAGDAQARAQLASGDAWSRAFSNMGTIAAGTIQRATSPERQIEQLQLTEAQRANKSRNVFEAELRNPANYKEDGSVDDAKVAERLKQQDIGAWQQWSTISAATQKARLDAAEKVATINKTNLETDEKQRQIGAAQSQYLGTIAYHALDTIDRGPGDPLHARDTALAALARASADRLIAPDQARQLSMQLASADAHQLQQVLGSVIDPQLKAKLDAESATQRKTIADATKAEAEAGAITKFGSTTPPAAQSKTFRVKGVGDVPVEFLPGRTPEQPGRYFLNDASGRREVFPGKDFVDIPPASLTIHNDVKGGGPGDYAQTGDDFLKTIPVEWRTTVKKIANYEEDPTKVASMRGGMREQLTRWVNQVNPAYDASQFSARAPMRRAFTSGPQSQTINSLNTAIEHLDQFVDVAKALGNGNFQPGNAAYNWLKTTFGDSAPTNFEGIRSIMSGELASAFKKSGATDQEIAEVQRAIASKNSTKQLTDYATTIAIPALGGKIASFNDQFHQVFGPDDPFKIVLPSARAVLEKYGFDPEHPKMGGGADTKADVPTAHALGDVVVVNGQKVRVTKVLPNGKYEGQVVQ
jgi:hypothetical protein